jgi:hypothetical protein
MEGIDGVAEPALFAYLWNSREDMPPPSAAREHLRL